MTAIILLFSMMFFHIVDDFYSQPIILSNLKQKSWWQKNAPDTKYKDDYLIALLIHAFSWTFMIHIPLIGFLWITNALNRINWEGFVIIFLANLVIHFYIDNLKANELKLNLIQDQFIHLVQIVITWLIYLNIL